MPTSPKTKSKANNRNLHAAKTGRNDEFYTQLSDIEKELKHYTKHFKGKTVLCNCDDPGVSKFFHYFAYGFNDLGLKKLVTTCYRSHSSDHFGDGESKNGICLEYCGGKSRIPNPDDIKISILEGDGDFRSPECVELLKASDVVVTNPPFSLFREYIAQLVKYKKKFLVIGNINAVKYKDIFPLIKAGKLWLGHMHPKDFIVPGDYEMRASGSWRDEKGTNWRSLGNACWFTNLDFAQRREDLILYRTYNPKDYPTYDNYAAIEVSKCADIPMDYDGVMGVPITFMDKYNPSQFEILGCTQSWNGCASKIYPRQIQVGADGKRSNVMKLNDGPATKITKAPYNETYYIVNGELFSKSYCRILVKRLR